MQVRILGPVEVDGPSGVVPVDSPKERALLDVLALRAGQWVSTEVLIDALWGSAPPQSAVNSLQSHVSRLRTRLPHGAIDSADGRYRYAGPAEDVDVYRFERLVGAGVQALQGGDARRAWAMLEEALDQWRGPPLVDLAEASLREGEVARLEELRWAAREGQADAALALGRHEELIADLEALVAEQPLREHPWGQLMLALHRSGRRSEALDAYQRARRLLREELGVEPGEELGQLEVRILQGDPALIPDRPEPPMVVPAYLTSFVGREPQLVEVAKQLDGHRLVTLLGPGGVGKSRLAVEVASRERGRWPDGVWWVDVARTDDVDVVLSRLVRALDVVVPPGMRDVDALRQFLGARRVLVVVDNAEDVAERLGRRLLALLEAAPRLTVLVTSRVPLDVVGEQRVTVPPLGLPGPDDDPSVESEAMRVLIDRLAERGGPEPGRAEVPDLAALCRLVDGLPLGLELVAAQVGQRPPGELLNELEQVIGATGASRTTLDDRHASLEVVIDHTVARLQSDEWDVLARLSVFLGGFDLDAARAVGQVTEPDSFDRLVDLSLVLPVSPVASSGRRYRLLDTTRSFVAGRLRPSLLASATRVHARHYRDLVVEAGQAMDGPDEPQWLSHLLVDDLEIRAALAWHVEHEPAGALAFARALGQALYIWGEIDATLAHMDQLVAIGETVASPEILPETGWAHLRRAWPRFLTGDLTGADQDTLAAGEIFRSSGESTGSALALATRAHMIMLATADTDAALDQYRRAIEAAGSGREYIRGWVLAQAAQALVFADRADDEVDRMLDEADRVFSPVGEHAGAAHVEMVRALAAYARDDLDAVERAAESGLEHAAAAGEHSLYRQLHVLIRGVARLYREEPQATAPEIVQATAMANDAHNLFQLGLALQAAAVHQAMSGEAVVAARLWGAGQRLAPVWPLFQRRYDPLLERARRELGPQFDDEVAVGGAMPLDEAVALTEAGERNTLRS